MSIDFHTPPRLPRVSSLPTGNQGDLVYLTTGSAGIYYYNGSAWIGPLGTTTSGSGITIGQALALHHRVAGY